jgi:hypothetical protein
MERNQRRTRAAACSSNDLDTKAQPLGPSRGQSSAILNVIGTLTAEECLSEVGGILAAGLIRLLARKSSQKSALGGDILLASSADQSGPMDPMLRSPDHA